MGKPEVLIVAGTRPEALKMAPVQFALAESDKLEPVLRLPGDHQRICLAKPSEYYDFVWLMSRCHFLLSDSGGVQEEAPSLVKPVLVMRETTERPEGIEAGTCRLVGTDPVRIAEEASLLLGDAGEYERRSELRNPYGDGRAAMRIRERLERDL